MAFPLVKKIMFWIMLSGLLILAACSRAMFPQAKPITQLTPAEQEELDPEFWRLWEERRGLGE
jgi:hypothetical protein